MPENMTDDVRRVFLYTSGRIDVMGPEMETNAVIMRDEDHERLRAELAEAKKWMSHAADIGHFSNCRKCGMPVRPGCVCEACGWDRSDDDE